MHQIQQRKLTALYYHGNTIHVKCKPNKFNLSNSHGLTAPPDGLQPAWQSMHNAWLRRKIEMNDAKHFSFTVHCRDHLNWESFFHPEWVLLQKLTAIIVVQKRSSNSCLATQLKSNKRWKDRNHKRHNFHQPTVLWHGKVTTSFYTYRLVFWHVGGFLLGIPEVHLSYSLSIYIIPMCPLFL